MGILRDQISGNENYPVLWQGLDSVTNGEYVSNSRLNNMTASDNTCDFTSPDLIEAAPTQQLDSISDSDIQGTVVYGQNTGHFTGTSSGNMPPDGPFAKQLPYENWYRNQRSDSLSWSPMAMMALSSAPPQMEQWTESPNFTQTQAMQTQMFEKNIFPHVSDLCPHCPRPYYSPSDLKRHHRNDDHCTRDGCDDNKAKGFSRRDVLRRHQKRKH